MSIALELLELLLEPMHPGQFLLCYFSYQIPLKFVFKSEGDIITFSTNFKWNLTT